MIVRHTDIETEVVPASEIDGLRDMVWYGDQFREAHHRINLLGMIKFHFLPTTVEPTHLVRRAVSYDEAKALMNRKRNADRAEMA